MIKITDYTTYADVRAVLGVSEYEVEDTTLALATYASALQRALRSTSDSAGKTLYAYFDELDALPSPTEAQDTLLGLIKDFSTYTVAEVCLSGLSLTAMKQESDGKTTAVRFSAESTFLSVSNNIRSKLETIKSEITVALGATVSYNTISLVNRVIPETDPVTE